MFDNRKAILWQPRHPALCPTLGNYRTIKILKQQHQPSLSNQTGGEEGRREEVRGNPVYWRQTNTDIKNLGGFVFFLFFYKNLLEVKIVSQTELV